MNEHDTLIRMHTIQFYITKHIRVFITALVNSFSRSYVYLACSGAG